MKTVTIYTDGETCSASSIYVCFARPLRGNRETQTARAVVGR